FTGGDSKFLALSATAQKDVVFGPGRTITATGGGLSFTATTGAMTDTGDLTLKATTDVDLNGNLTTNTTTPGSGLSVTADSDNNGSGAFSFADTTTIKTNDNALHITAASMTLTGGRKLDSGTASTTIEASNNETIGLGTGAAGDISLDNAVLGNIKSGALVVGGLNTGTITVSGYTSSAQGPVTLIAGSKAVVSDILFSGSASTFASAAAGLNAIKGTADHDINVNVAISTNPAGDVYLEAGNQLTIGPAGSITTAGVSGGTLTVNGGITIHDVNVGAGNVTLIAHGTGADLTVGNVTIASNIVLQAPRDVIVVGTIKTTTGTADITLTADVDNTGDGGVWITAIGNVDAGRNLLISGSDLFNRTLAGGFTPDLPTATHISIHVADNAVNDPLVAGGSVTLKSSSAAAIPATSDIVLEGIVRSSGPGAVDITAKHEILTQSDISSNGGTIQFHAPVVLTGTTDVTTNGTGGIAFDAQATVNSVDNVTPQVLNLTAGKGGITTNAAIGGNHVLGVITANAANGVTFNANVTTNAAINVNADTDATGTGTFSVGAAATVKTTSHDLTIIAKDVALAGKLNSGTAITSIDTAQDETIGLGNTAGDLTISGAELQNITAAELDLGDNSALTSHTKSITVDGISSANSANIDLVQLNALIAPGTISFLNGNSTFTWLKATALNDIVFDSGRTLTANTDGLVLTSQNGNITDAGTLTLQAKDGITLNSNVNTGTALSGSGKFTLNSDADNDGAGTLTLAAGNFITTNNSDLTATFGVLNLPGAGAGILNTGNTAIGGTTTLSPTNLQTIGVGNAVGGFTADATLLGKITAQHLTIGGTLNGNITVDGLTTAIVPNVPGTITLLALNANDSISFVNNPSNFHALTARAHNGINVQQNLTTVGSGVVAGAISLDGDFDNAAAPGTPADNIVFNPGVTITSSDSITLKAQTSKMTDTGNLTLNAVKDVTIQSNLTTNTTTPGAGLAINADTDTDAAGTFTVTPGSAVFTSNSPLNIIAADIDLQNAGASHGTISAGTGAANAPINLMPSTTGATIGIGAAGTSFSLSNAEIGNIINTTGLVTVGLPNNLGGVQLASAEVVDKLGVNLKVITGAEILLGNNDFTTTSTKWDVTLVADGDGNLTGRIANEAKATGDPTTGRLGANLLTLRAAEGINVNTTSVSLDAINTTSGDIDIHETASFLTPASNLAINQIWQQGPGQITIVSAGQITQGVSPGGQNIKGTTLEMIAANGIGSATPLQTAVSTLAVRNGPLNNIQIVNQVGGPLNIGHLGTGGKAVSTTVGTTDVIGVTNTTSNKGSIFIETDGAMTVLANDNVTNTGGGNTTLTSDPGAASDMTINARILAFGGNGNINLNAGHDLFVNESGFDPDVMAEGTGNITAVAQHSIVLANNVHVDAAQGNISWTALKADLTTNAQIHVNGGAGNISLDAGGNLLINDSNGPGATPDLETKGTGSIFGEAGSALNLAPNVLVQADHGGHIEYTTHTGDITSNARIFALGGSGNIHFNAGNNLNIFDSGFATEMFAEGAGRIIGIAQNQVTLGNNVSLQTAQGWRSDAQSAQVKGTAGGNVQFIGAPVTPTITALHPVVNDVRAEQVIVTGLEVLHIDFSEPGGHDFLIVIDWGDHVDNKSVIGGNPSLQLISVSEPGSYTFTHVYKANPDPNNPAAPIPILVMVFHDSRISLSGHQSQQITGTIGHSDRIPLQVDYTYLNNASIADLPTNQVTQVGIINPTFEANRISRDLQLGFSSSFVPVEDAAFAIFSNPGYAAYQGEASVPGLGLGLITIDSNIYISKPQQSVAPSASAAPTGPPPQGSQTQAADAVARAGDTSTAEERQVIIQRLDDDDNVLSEVRMPESILDNLDGLFDTLKNGRFRISVIEPGESKPRVLLDNVNLRGGKPASDVEEGDKPPTTDAVEGDAGQPQAAAPAADQDALSLARPGEESDASDRAVAVALSARRSTDGDQTAGKTNFGPDGRTAAHRSRAGHMAAGAALGLTALAASVGTDSWEERVDAALAVAGAGALSKSARLARRLRNRGDRARRSGRKLGKV
ncbi:MAG: hypothetical protein HY290_22530, partial [Planctomycetia bacterium]|nr:hypothetical protein [Planctomycetia bacterium]